MWVCLAREVVQDSMTPWADDGDACHDVSPHDVPALPLQKKASWPVKAVYRNGRKLTCLKPPTCIIDSPEAPIRKGAMQPPCFPLLLLVLAANCGKAFFVGFPGISSCRSSGRQFEGPKHLHTTDRVHYDASRDRRPYVRRRRHSHVR